MNHESLTTLCDSSNGRLLIDDNNASKLRHILQSNSVKWTTNEDGI